MSNNTDIANLYDIIITKAPIFNPIFRGSIGGISKDMIGLDRVDNTSDIEKIISDAARQVFETKAPLYSPQFEGIATAPTVSITTNSDQIATTAFVHEITKSLNEIDEKTTNINFNPFNQTTIISHNLIASDLNTNSIKSTNIATNDITVNNLDKFKQQINLDKAETDISDIKQKLSSLDDISTQINSNLTNLNVKIDNAIDLVGTDISNKIDTSMSQFNSDLTLTASVKSINLTGIPVAPTADTDTSTNQIATTAFVKNNTNHTKLKTTNIIYDPKTNLTKIYGNLQINNLIVGAHMGDNPTESEQNSQSNNESVYSTNQLNNPTSMAIIDSQNRCIILDLTKSDIFYIDSKTQNCCTYPIKLINLPTSRITMCMIKIYWLNQSNQSNQSNPTYFTKLNASDINSTYIYGNSSVYLDIPIIENGYLQSANLIIQALKILYDPILSNIFNIKSDVLSF
jgi:hypothetical protein